MQSLFSGTPLRCDEKTGLAGTLIASLMVKLTFDQIVKIGMSDRASLVKEGKKFLNEVR